MNNSFKKKVSTIWQQPLLLASAMVVAVAFMFTSCEESDFNLTDEASTPYEADIRYIVLEDPSIMTQPQDSIKASNINDGKDNLTIMTNENADLKSITPRFVLTKGAKILAQDSKGEWTVNAEALSLDFSSKKHSYMIVSANGKSHRIYTLRFACRRIPLVNNFEFAVLNDSSLSEDGSKFNEKVAHYYMWPDQDNDMFVYWSTANGGFGVSRSTAHPDEYPSTPCEGVNGGKGVKLTTSNTGGIAATMGMRIAAGNLFLGTFDISSALKAPLTSTKFGYPFAKKPVKVTGWMSYQPGEKYQNKEGRIIEERKDSCDIYAILYRNTDKNGNAIMLDGSNIGSSPSIVAKASLDPSLAAGTNGEWRPFTIMFDYDKYSIPFDEKISKEYGYSLTVVCTSSTQGAYFWGAIGSTLKVDEITIICNEE